MLIENVNKNSEFPPFRVLKIIENTVFYCRPGGAYIIFNVAKGLNIDQVSRIWEACFGFFLQPVIYIFT